MLIRVLLSTHSIDLLTILQVSKHVSEISSIAQISPNTILRSRHPSCAVEVVASPEHYFGNYWTEEGK